MFQKDNLFEWISVWKNVTLGTKNKKKLNEENLERVEKLIKTMIWKSLKIINLMNYQVE